MFSSLKFSTKPEYMKLFKKFESKWNQPMFMVHLNHIENFKTDLIIFVPRYFISNFFTNTYSSYGRNSFQLAKVGFEQFPERLLPQWFPYGIGIIKLQNLMGRKTELNAMKISEENRLKMIVSKFIIQILTNFSLRDPMGYIFFWKIYQYPLKTSLIRKPVVLKNFSHLIRFFSTKSKISPISLEEYVCRMKPYQNKIYFFSIKKK